MRRMIKAGLNAQLLSPDPGYRAAGIHNYIHGLLTHLPAVAGDGWDFHAFVGSRITQQYEGVSLHHSRLDTASPFKRIVWEQVLQPWQLGAYDVYHAMAFVTPVVLRKPAVVTVYDLSFIHYPQRLSRSRRLYLNALTAHSCRRAQRVIAISESTARDLTDAMGIPAKKIDVTPLSYDAARYAPLPDEQVRSFRQNNNLPERFWLFLGTLEPRKNLPVLLEAYAKLRDDERLPLVIAGGKGWQTDDIYATMDRHHLHEQVTFAGFVDDADIALWYNAAEVFLYPSVYEGFGLPVLEAMACGTPVITTNVSSLPEVARDAGLTLSPHDVDGWADALRMVERDSGWRERASQAGLQKARQFTPRTTARLTIDSYERAMSHTL